MLVGAQRPASALGTDAGMNLVNALRVAGCDEARGKGVLVVLNNEIHPARDVVKTSTYRVQTFRSLDYGALGHVDGDGAAFLPRAVEGAHARYAVRRARDRRIAARRHDLFLCRRRWRSCRGGGHGRRARPRLGRVRSGQPEPGAAGGLLAAAKSGIVVVQCSRATGRIAPRRRLRETGIVAGEDLTPQKARILLALMLLTTRDIAAIQQAFRAIERPLPGCSPWPNFRSFFCRW